jgi:DNA mismatch repair protein MutL
MQSKPVIQLLPDQVINKIAAGEVVERPASVMKELFENSLDAGATQVDVEVIRGGRQLIAITDNGCGMRRDQALLSIERHATSKIRSEADIENIHTLGFRGEALAAISSVSRFTLISRTEDALAGTEIQIAGGKMLNCEDIGCPVGTRIEIRNLFFNVPARRKFLRAEQTELVHIRQLFLVHALAHPDIGMSLKVDERIVYNLPMAGKMEDRITELYSTGFFEQLLPVDYSDGDYTISGYAGLPQTGRKDRQDQYLFVNGRPATAPVVYHALNEAYHSLIARGRYPAVFLFIEMEPTLVDVNVHPTKKEVRFRRPNQLRDAVVAALNKALTIREPEVGSQRSEPGGDDGEKVSLPPPIPVRPRFATQKKMDDLLVRPEIVQRAEGRGQRADGERPSTPAHPDTPSPPQEEPLPQTSNRLPLGLVPDRGTDR